jgi:hypothetical protein
MRCIPNTFSAVILTMLLLSSQLLHAKDPNNYLLSKIEFDLSILDPNGLYGPPDGLKSLGYEFCIPANATKIAEIHSIDPDIKIYKQSQGRIGCNNNEYLCMGETHNKAYQTILTELAQLPYIKRISQSFYE